MTGGVAVGYGELSAIAATLRAAAGEAGGPGSELPEVPPDVVGGTVAMETAAHLLRQYGHLCLALESAGEAIEATRTSYEAADRSSSERQRSLMERR